MIAGSALLIISHSVLGFSSLAPRYPMMVLGAAFVLVPAALWPAIPLLVRKNMVGTAFGVLTQIQNIGLFAFPKLNGWLRESTGGYTASLTNTILVGHDVGITVTAGNTATLAATLWGEGSWLNAAPWGGDGQVFTSTDVTGDPAFVDPDNGDYHLTAGSAAIEAGVPAGVDVDIDGEPRKGKPDLGADEFPTSFIYLPLVLRE